MSGAEADLFVESVNDFVKKVKELGPLGKGEGIDEDALKFRLEAVTKLIPYIRLVERERLRMPLMIGRRVPHILRQRRAGQAI